MKKIFLLLLILVIVSPLISPTNKIGTDLTKGKVEYIDIAIIESITYSSGNVSHLNNLSDVTITSPADKDILSYNSSSSLWENIQSYWCELTGCEITGNLNVTGNITTQNWVNGKFNWTVGDDWATFNGVSWIFNDAKLSTIYYNATQSSLVAGTIDGGTLRDTQHKDTNYDGNTFNFSEEAGSPGLDMRINFTNVSAGFTQGVIRYKTSSIFGVPPVIEVWDYNSSSWEDYPSLVETPIFETISQPVFDSAKHIQNGTVRMRLYKATNGNINNHYYVDWLAIAKGYGVPSGNEVDSFSIHKDGTSVVTANIPFGSYNVSAEYFFGNISTYNATYDNFAYNQSLATFTMWNDTWDESGLIDDLNTSVTNRLTVYNNSASDFTIYVNSTAGAYTDAQSGRIDSVNNSLLWKNISGTAFYNGNVNISGNLTINNSVLFADANTGKVGIGTTSPNASLEISSIASSDVPPVIRLTGNAGESSSIGEIDFYDESVAYAQIQGQNLVNSYGRLMLRASNTSGVMNTIMTLRGNDGNVGIGTTSPSSKLQVNGGVNFNKSLYVIESTGNVGIGTNSPGQPLTTRGAIRHEFDGTNWFDLNPVSSSVLRFSGNTGTSVNFQMYDGTASYLLDLYNGATNAVRIHTNGDSWFNGGDVGIGTASPSTDLHVKGPNDNSWGQVIIEGETGTNAGVSFKTIAGAGTARSWMVQSNYQAAGGLSIMRSTTQNGVPTTAVMELDSSGKVGIGTITPAYKLVVSDGGNLGLEIDPTAPAGAGTNINVLAYDRVAIAYKPLHFFASAFAFSTGNVGIGTLIPTDALTVVGDINVSGCIQEDDGTLIGGTCVSDSSLKTNIVEDYGNLSNMGELKVKEFDWVNESVKIGNITKQLDTKGRGFIAEEVEAVYPERVKQVGDYKFVSYGFDWIFDLWIASQKHETEIKELKDENDLMKNYLCSQLNATEFC